MSRLIDTLRTGAFLTAERLLLWPAALLAGFAVALAFLCLSAHGLSDYAGRPLGSDFSNVYAAGRFALTHHASAPFDPARQYAGEQAIFGHSTPFYGWHYPPIFLLIAASLAKLPYLAALATWQVVTLLLYLAALAVLLREGPKPELAGERLWVLIALAYPAVFVNLTHGHNGFLTAALLAGALAVLDTHEILAGILFGALAYKPQFGILIPIALAAGGRWRAFLGAALSVALLIAVTTLVFGWDVWSAFAGSMPFTRSVVLEQGGAGFGKIESVFAGVRLLGGSVVLAYGVQLLVTVAFAWLLARLWRSNASGADKGAALCLAAFVATPYAFDYDMMALAPAIALLGAQGIARGFRPYEKTILALLWVLPAFARGLGVATRVPVGPIVLVAATGFVFAATLRINRGAGLQSGATASPSSL